MTGIWLLTVFALLNVLAYQRASLWVSGLSITLFLILTTFLGNFSQSSLIMAWVVFIAIYVPWVFVPLRKKILTRRALGLYRKAMPTMSRTEREALAAGTVGWEGELFRGNPNWHRLLKIPKATLSIEEQAFISGPVDILCSMINEWNITYERADLTPEIWNFLKAQGFFSLIIPKEYGGKNFSAYAQSQILTKVYGCSASVATTIAVPNSLGPAELLLHYGTSEQQNYYLPRLARGEEIPCFALTGPDAGSDAGAMTDTGIICWGEYLGKQTLGIRLNCNKRYITLAPVATVIGLAFKLSDPEHLLGSIDEYGITCALIPRETPGVNIGRRHMPANAVFQNGPIQIKDAFVPLDTIIGGPKMAGQGWRMLMECLAVGRAISLPSSSMGGAKVLAFATGAYARIRRQFNVPIGRFEGIEEVLGRIFGLTYIMDATRTFTTAVIDAGEKPAVASAITKYHLTELGRTVVTDAMDIHGGKAVCLGPNNYIASFYQSAPIAITVEGANILTRNLIIFGQGAMRCHPYIYAEVDAALSQDPKESLKKFDKVFTQHIGFTISNFVRSFWLGLTSAYIVVAPGGKTKRYFQNLTRYSAGFALLADVSLIVLGGTLKRKENISARLGDILSYLYMLSAVLKHYEDQGKISEDFIAVQWSVETLFYQIEQRFDEILRNFPNRAVSFFLRNLLFPFGMNAAKPSDISNQKLAQLLQSPTESRDRLIYGMYRGSDTFNQMGLLEDALAKVITAESVEKIIKAARDSQFAKGATLLLQAHSAFENNIISEEQLNCILAAEAARAKIIAVDDFASDELGHRKSVLHKGSTNVRETE